MEDSTNKEKPESPSEENLTGSEDVTERENNLYAAKKSVAQGMMDVALITANANQLRFVMEYNQGTALFAVVVTLITISLLLQVAVGVCLIFKGRADLKGKDKFDHANRLNNLVVGGVFLITIINVFVATFSMNPPPTPAAVAD